MPRPRDFLERFRPAGTPGAAAAAGVPADRVAELSAELEPLLATLADTQSEVSRVRSAADREAARRRRSAEERGRALVAAAARQAEAERAEASALGRRQAEVEATRTLESAAAEADAIRDRARHRLPAYVDRALDAARAAARDLGGPA